MMQWRNSRGQNDAHDDLAFRSLVENAAVPIALADLRGRFTYVNQALVDMLGYSVQELLGRSFKDFLHPADSGKIFRLFLRIIALRRSPRTLEFRVKTSDGRILDMLSKPTRFVVNGKTKGFQAVITDISELKEMERKLQEANVRLSTLLETAEEGITTTDPYENLTFTNKAFANMLGYEEDELVGMNLRNLVDEQDFGKLEEQTRKRMRNETSRYELRMYRRDGESMAVQITASPLRRKDGGFAGTLGVVVNINERKRIEEALRNSEKRFRAIVDSAREAIVMADDEEKISLFNPAAEKMFGYSRKEAVGKPMLLSLVPKQFHQAMHTALKAFGKTGSETIVGQTLVSNLQKKNGTEFPVELSISAFQMKGEWQFVGIIRDITERKQMEEKLKEYAECLEQKVEERTRELKQMQELLLKSERMAAIGQVAAMVGHDLRNPLTGIKSATYYLKTKLKSKIEPKCIEMFELIEKDIEYSNKIINDLLDFSRDINLQLAETTPEAIMKQTLDLVEIPENIQVINLIGGEPTTKVDAEKMKRVFANLIRNAIDAMPNGGKLTISSRESNGKIELIIADTGIGMSKEVIDKLWTPFFTTKAKGMGLGLAICKRIVEAHDGRISVNSTVGKGTILTIALPSKPESRKPSFMPEI